MMLMVSPLGRVNLVMDVVAPSAVSALLLEFLDECDSGSQLHKDR